MEKTSSLPNKPGALSLFSKSKARLLGKLAPGLAKNQIDSMLFIPRTTESKAVRLPRGFEQHVIKTSDGKLQAYRTGRGPTVVFVHGWCGGAHQFFPLMRGLARCGFSSLAFDQLGHGLSDRKQATLQQSIASCNFVLNQVRRSDDGLCMAVGHATGCIAIANANPDFLKNVPLFLIAPIFNYKLHFLKRLVKLGLPADVVKQYANRFSKTYRSEYQKLELANKLSGYADVTAIAHDESDTESAVADSIDFCNRYPLARLMVTRSTDHVRVINSESVWQELKSHLNYDDTTINFSSEILGL
jgi:pimeloyl-ACP methyl ester carboxylesterase